MKKLSKILSLVLALAMVVMSFNVMVVNANDTKTGTIQITGIDTSSSAEFVAYQIFHGTGTGENSDVLDPQPEGKDHIMSNIAYSDYVNSKLDAFITALNGAKVSGKSVFTSELKNTDTAATVAAALSKIFTDYGDDSREAGAVASALKGFFATGGPQTYKGTAATGTCTIDNVPEGYYLIVDTTTESVLPGLLRVIDDITNTMAIKDVDPTVKKEVTYTDNYTYGIGDTVPFKVTIHIPDDVSLYDEFDLTLVDTAKNMKFDPATLDINVTLDSKPQDKPVQGAGSGTDHYTYTITSDSSGGADNVLTLKHYYDPLTDADHWDDYAGKELVVTYNAVITNNAYQFDDTSNTATITYSNGPDTEGTSTSTVKVLNLGFTLNKVTGDGSTPLGGAGFTVQKWNGRWVTLEDNVNTQITESTESGGEGTGANKFEYRGLGDGWYRITESTVPAGYNTWATKIIHVETTLNNPNTATPTLATYTITAYNDKSDFDGTATELTPASDTTFSCETSTGMATANIVNNKGTSLPETGGMGTKIFYTLGGLLVACAVVLLVVKRRMRTE